MQQIGRELALECEIVHRHHGGGPAFNSIGEIGHCQASLPVVSVDDMRDEAGHVSETDARGDPTKCAEAQRIVWPLRAVCRRIWRSRPIEKVRCVEDKEIKGPHSGIPAAVKELYAKLEEGGYHICGPLMKVYYNDSSKTPDDELLWDVRIAVTNPGSMLKVEMGELGFGYLESVYVAYTYHTGTYDKVRESYDLLLDWAETTKHEVTGYMTELYWGPEGSDTPVIEIWLPVREKAPSERVKR